MYHKEGKLIIQITLILAAISISFTYPLGRIFPGIPTNILPWIQYFIYAVIAFFVIIILQFFRDILIKKLTIEASSTLQNVEKANKAMIRYILFSCGLALNLKKPDCSQTALSDP